MSNKSIEIPIEIVDRFSKTLKSLQKSMDELALPAKLIASFLELEKKASKAKEEINLFTLAVKAFIGLTASVSILKAADKIEEFGNASKLAAKGATLLRGAAAATGVAFAALIAIDLASWLWGLFNASTEVEKAIKALEEEYRRFKDTVRDNIVGSQALIDEYFELRDKTNLTSEETARLKELADRLADAMPEYANEVRNLTADYGDLQQQLERIVLVEATKDITKKLLI